MEIFFRKKWFNLRIILLQGFKINYPSVNFTHKKLRTIPFEFLKSDFIILNYYLET